MAKVIFTPWKDNSQLLSVRTQFYPPPTYTGPDMRRKACATVAAWKLRGNLPHAVEATSLLTDAILHDNATTTSLFSIRATYAAAFCRFVTLLVDSKLPGLKGKTMFQRAVDLGLPASFVELRHEATHRELPSLVVLRNAAQRSLEWLWDFYWVKVDLSVPGGQGAVGASDVEGSEIEPAKTAIRDCLSELTAEGEPPRKKRRRLEHRDFVAEKIGSICSASASGKIALAGVLVEYSVLIPQGRRLGGSLDDMFDKWDGLLQAIIQRQPGCLTALAEELLNELAFTALPNPKENTYCEGLYLWLDHILTSTEWGPSRRVLSLAYITEICNQDWNYWTEKLRTSIRTSDDDSSIPSTEGERHDRSSKPEVVSSDGPTDSRKYGWETPNRWDSRPIGIA